MTGTADHLDQAQELTTQLNDAYVSNARRLSAPEQVQRADGSWPQTECDCGEPLGARLQMGKIRCLACQEDLEKAKQCRR